eukprot:860350-Prorocentrum_minimum.AAC.1
MFRLRDAAASCGLSSLIGRGRDARRARLPDTKSLSARRVAPGGRVRGVAHSPRGPLLAGGPRGPRRAGGGQGEGRSRHRRRQHRLPAR